MSVHIAWQRLLDRATENPQGAARKALFALHCHKQSAVEKRIRNIDEEVRKSVERDIRNSRDRISEIGKEQDGLGNIVYEEFRQRIEFEESEIERIRRETENCEDTISKKFYRDLKYKSEELPKELKDLFQEQRLLDDFKDTQCKEERYKATRKFLAKRTWEKE